MREYGKVGPGLWIGETGKRLRGCPEAQVVAAYLLSSPHANMLGLYYLPLAFLRHETGLSEKGASKGLRRAIEAYFCAYEHTSEVVWVFEMARYQISDGLKPDDKRCKGIQNEYDGLPQNGFLSAFFEKYVDAFHLTKRRENTPKITSPSEAPSKGHRSQEQEQEQEQEHKKKKKSGGDFLTALKANPAYKHIDIPTELAKMDAWLLVHPGRQKTHRFVVGWLNKIPGNGRVEPSIWDTVPFYEDCPRCGASHRVRPNPEVCPMAEQAAHA